MSAVLYLYDCKGARQKNARRVAFTKELYGYTYSWKTKSGIKEKKKTGLLDQYPGSEAILDSAIYVPKEHKSIFDSFFEEYEDILTLRVFLVSGSPGN